MGDRSRYTTPSPDARDKLAKGCFRLFIAWAGVFLIAAVLLDDWRVSVPAAVSVPAFMYLAVEAAYRLKMALRWQSRGVRGLVVYSESPHWKAYIEREWLPRLAPRFIVLNWSERKRWQRSFPVKTFYWYCGREWNFNPSIILPRGQRGPLVFRFYNAFRDAKHGNLAALDMLERRLFEELGMEYAGCTYSTFQGRLVNGAERQSSAQ